MRLASMSLIRPARRQNQNSLDPKALRLIWNLERIPISHLRLVLGVMGRHSVSRRMSHRNLHTDNLNSSVASRGFHSSCKSNMVQIKLRLCRRRKASSNQASDLDHSLQCHLQTFAREDVSFQQIQKYVH